MGKKIMRHGQTRLAAVGAKTVMLIPVGKRRAQTGVNFI